MDTQTIDRSGSTTDPGPTRTFIRLLPLAGAVFGVLSFVADGVIGDFPDGDTTPAALTRYYAAHHAGVAQGGMILGWGAVFFGLFVAALVLRTRSMPLVAAIIGVGGAAQLAHEEWSAASYALVGDLGAEHGVSPQALQAWHIAGSEFGLGSAMAVFLIGVGLAGIVGRYVPAWLAWSGLAFGLGQLLLHGVWGFWSLMLVMLWCVVAGIALAVRPGPSR